MSFNKDRVMQELQRFGGAMYTPVILFAFFGLTVALSIIFSNTGLFGSLAEKGTLWYDFWYVVQQGAWTVFNQMPILFAIAVPIGFAKKEQARCAMEGFVIYMVFNYFIAGILTLHGSYFGVDYSQNAGAGTGLAMIANIKTLDMGMLGAIFIACISAYLHNHFYDTEIPDWLGIFKGPAFVVAVGFLVMLPMALLFCYIWPPIQHGIEQFQFFLKTSGIFGVWAYTFSERILLPAGLHHFIYLPFIYGPAVCDGGIQAYWLQHLNDFATSAHSLRDMFPQGGFALHGSAKVFGLVKNGHAIQVIVGLSVPNVRGHFDALMKGEMPAAVESTVTETKEASAETPAAPAAESIASVDEDDRSMKLKAFVSGDLVDISEVPDDAFSQKMMGDGVAIKPSGDTIVAPADATVSMIMESSLHAIGLELSNGAEVLIHIGLDTVNMNGDGFTLLTQQDAQVKAGDPLIRFDRDAIAKAGYNDIVIMAVTNSTEYPQMKKEPDQPVVAGETPIVIF